MFRDISKNHDEWRRLIERAEQKKVMRLPPRKTPRWKKKEGEDVECSKCMRCMHECVCACVRVIMYICRCV